MTELVARPLLSIVAPGARRLRRSRSPGRPRARRDLLEGLPFPVGYGVEIAMLIDALRARGLDALAQVDLGVRLNRHQPLRELGAMALAVMGAGLRRGLPADAVRGARAGPDAGAGRRRGGPHPRRDHGRAAPDGRGAAREPDGGALRPAVAGGP